jgi:hypothetical protein
MHRVFSSKLWILPHLVLRTRNESSNKQNAPADLLQQLVLACNVLAALVHPLFMAGLCYSLLGLTPLQGVATMESAPVFAATLLCGYISTIALDLIGLKRRRLLAHAWVLALTPLYWFLLSFAAWRGLFQLFYAPQRWEKTAHGLARTSRLSDASHQCLATN